MTGSPTSRIPMPQSPVVDLKTGYARMEWYRYFNQPNFQNVTLSGSISVANGGTGLTSGIPGGVLTFVGPTTIASSASLGTNQIVLGGGTGVPSTPVGLGSQTSVLHGGNVPSWGPVNLSTDTVGSFGVTQGGTGLTAGTTGGLLYFTNPFNMSSLAVGSAGNFLTVKSGNPAWNSFSSVLTTTPTIALTYNSGANTIQADIVQITATALTALSYPNIVCLNSSGQAYYPDLTNPVDVSSIIGVTLNAAAIGAPVTIAISYQFTSGAWSWTTGRLFCALSGGGFVQTPPATGAIVEVARALNPTTIMVRLGQTTLR